MSVYQGRVTKIDSDEVWVEISDLALGQQFPVRWVNTNLVVGDIVLVVGLDGAQEDLIVVGKMGASIINDSYYIALDTDGVPYIVITDPVPDGTIKLDTDGVPYYEI